MEQSGGGPRPALEDTQLVFRMLDRRPNTAAERAGHQKLCDALQDFLQSSAAWAALVAAAKEFQRLTEKHDSDRKDT